jgi:hypothetical protein
MSPENWQDCPRCTALVDTWVENFDADKEA